MDWDHDLFFGWDGSFMTGFCFLFFEFFNLGKFFAVPFSE